MKIDGKLIAQKNLDDLKKEIQEKKIVPKMAVILLGNDPASVAYIKQKKLKSEYIVLFHYSTYSTSDVE